MSANESTPVAVDHSIILNKIRPFWKLGMASGILQILVGLSIFFPVVAPDSLKILVGIMVLVMALVAGSITFALRHAVNPTYGIIITVVRFVTAGLLLFHPLDTNITFTTLIAIYFGLDGALGVGEANKIRLVKPLYMVLMIVSIASIVLSASIWLFIKGASYVTISTLVALTFWLRGGTTLYMSWLAKNSGLPEDTSAAPAPAPAE